MSKIEYDPERRQFTVNTRTKIYKLDKQEQSDLMDAMLSFSESNEPQIGIFWLDVNECDLFGVLTADFKSIKPDLKNRRIYPKLHYQVWSKLRYKALAKGDRETAKKFTGNYTQVHRGRVNYENGKFVVYVGDWLPDYIEMLTPLIQAYFNIDDESDIEYVIDEHWNIGRGFSGDKFL